jgi:3-methyladenine DNA glycosylase AlkD
MANVYGDSVLMQYADQLTVPANHAGNPGISIPGGMDRDGLPIGIQLLGADFSEGKLFQTAHAFEQVSVTIVGGSCAQSLRSDNREWIACQLNARVNPQELRSQANLDNVAGMQRYGINSQGTLGISMPVVRRVARTIGVDHLLALQLWDSGLHEARILAGLIADPAQLSEVQMESWAADFDSWDVCDQVCSNLFDRTPLALRKTVEWSRREEPFVKRAGFVIMAALAVHDKRMPDAQFEAFLILIEGSALDDRNYVKKAVNWALRGIGKRNVRLNKLAIECAERIYAQDSRSAHWVAGDALRELRSVKIQTMLAREKL